MAKKRKAITATPTPEPVLAAVEEEEEKKPQPEDDSSTSNSEEEFSDSEVEEEEDDEQQDEEEDDSDEEEDEEENSEEKKRETLKKLLEPFGKDQIIEFLKDAALNSPSLFTRITEAADSDPTHCKIFVHGLGWDATHDQVLAAFKPYGDILDCKLVTDKLTGRAKGYAFILFKTRDGARKALKQPQKKIGNRVTSCQLASTGPVPNNPVTDMSCRKVFVANVGPQISPEKLRAFFANFGEIEEGPLGFDTVTGKFRGFAIFVYKTAEGCKKVLEEPVKVFEGWQLNCRKAVDGVRNNKNHQSVGLASSTASNGDVANAVLQTDMTNLNYGVGLSPGILGPNVNPGAVLVSQNPGGIGLVNPMLASAFNPAGLSHPFMASGLPSTQSLIGANYGINSASIGSYGSQAALQGLNAYQGAQLAQSSLGATPAVAAAAVATRPRQSGFGSVGAAFPSYFGR